MSVVLRQRNTDPGHKFKERTIIKKLEDCHMNMYEYIYLN